jgi:RNA polymerase sigma-70 factor (ECF subfamily)
MTSLSHSDHSRLSLLYHEHLPWLRGWLNSRVGCCERAADLAQDTFVRLLKNRSSVLIQEPRAYLSSVARGLVIDHYRRRALEDAYLQSLAHVPEQEVPSDEERLIILETLERLDRLLDQLSPRSREAFLLAQLEGLTCARIAERLGVSISTVERDLAKALAACYRLRYADE